MRISDWSSDVCSSDLLAQIDLDNTVVRAPIAGVVGNRQVRVGRLVAPGASLLDIAPVADIYVVANSKESQRSEEHTSQHQSLLRSSSALFRSKKNNHHHTIPPLPYLPRPQRPSPHPTHLPHPPLPT